VQICWYCSMPEIDSLVLIVGLRTLRYIFVLGLNRFRTRRFNIDWTTREAVRKPRNIATTLISYRCIGSKKADLNLIFFLLDNDQIFYFLYKSSANVLFVKIVLGFSTSIFSQQKYQEYVSDVCMRYLHDTFSNSNRKYFKLLQVKNVPSLVKPFVYFPENSIPENLFICNCI